MLRGIDAHDLFVEFLCHGIRVEVERADRNGVRSFVRAAGAVAHGESAGRDRSISPPDGRIDRQARRGRSWRKPAAAARDGQRAPHSQRFSTLADPQSFRMRCRFREVSMLRAPSWLAGLRSASCVRARISAAIGATRGSRAIRMPARCRRAFTTQRHSPDSSS